MGARCTRPAARPRLASVTLHIYDVGTSDQVKQVNNVLRPLGLGAFHTGVEVYGWEWSFQDSLNPEGTGIFRCIPRTSEGHVYREAVFMGMTAASEAEVQAIISELEKRWLGKLYDVLTMNCCHFSDELCKKLGVGTVPAWVLSLAGAGAAIVSAGEYLDLERRKVATCSSSLCCGSACGGADLGLLGEPMEEVDSIPALTN